MFLSLAVVFTVLFLIFAAVIFFEDDDPSKELSFFVILLGIATTSFWVLFGFSWKEKTYMDTDKIIITEAIAKVTGEKEADIASLVYLCDGDATIAEMLQIIDKNISEEEAKNFESLILKQLEKEED